MSTIPILRRKRTCPKKESNNSSKLSILDTDLLWLDEIHSDKIILRGRTYLIAKRALDIVLISLLFPIWLPLIIIIAFLIKLESPLDPIFFSQWRTGKAGRRFRMFKFRTMVLEAEKLKEKFSHLNKLKWPDFKIKNDPRVTRVGKFLRKTSLDEIPQILNVFRGEMTLIGPRPTSFKTETYALWQTERLDVKPGITGLWQIIGRGSTDFDKRTKLDILYIQKRCLWVDIQILLRTFYSMFNSKGIF